MSKVRTLSVRSTFLLKFLLPPIWIAGLGYAILQLWLRPEEVLLDGEAGSGILQWLLTGLFVASLAVLWAFVLPLKRVRLESDGLSISNYFREITVPFSAIESVRQNWLPTYRLITLGFRNRTPFGRRVIFMPAGRSRMAFWRKDYWDEDELVPELRKLATASA